MDFFTAFKLIAILLIEGIIIFQLAVFVGSKIFHLSDITKFFLKLFQNVRKRKRI